MAAVLAAVMAAAHATGPGTGARPAPGSATVGKTKPVDIWVTLEPGLDLGEFAAQPSSDRGDSIIRVLRADPKHFDLRLLNASAPGQGRARTARDWCLSAGLVAAINASMYQTDHRTSVSFMKTASHVNNPRLSKDRSVLAFDRLDASVPPFALLDRDCDFDRLQDKYRTLVQSIRMISCRRANVWAPQPRRSSTAAIGRDAQGRVLFIHARSPYSTHDLIDILLGLPLELERAMYVEGGPEAQLYVGSGGREREWVGSFETGFEEDDDNHRAWPVPNVIGLARRSGP